MSKSIKNFIANPGLLFISLGHRGWFHGMDDETYLKIAYRAKMGKKLNLDPPVTFNEKLQWVTDRIGGGGRHTDPRRMGEL